MTDVRSQRFSRSAIFRTLVLFVLRGLNTVSKFALALYTARFIGLADLGVYGLVVSVTTMLPAFTGLGTSDWILRNSAGVETSSAAKLMTSKLVMTAGLHAIVQPALLLLNYLLGTPVAWEIALLIGAIALLEPLSADACEFLTFRGRALYSNVLFFLRSGLWPIGVIVCGLIWPAARNLESLLLGWLAGLLFTWAALIYFTVRYGHWRHLGVNRVRFVGGIRESLPFYLKDVSIASGLYVDRFLISIFLGLEPAGIYTFYWSIANVLHNLTLYGVFQPNAPGLVQAAQKGRAEFDRVLGSVERQTALVAVLLALILAAATPFLLPYLGRPILRDYLAAFAIVVVATICRLGNDCYNYVLVALHKDRALALVSIASVPVTAFLYLLIIPLAGLNGAAASYLISAALLLAVRVTVRRAKN